MKFLNFDRVLCLGAHPDDVEYGMGGTILKCKDTIFDVFCLDLCAFYNADIFEIRNTEMIKAWKTLTENKEMPANVTLFFPSESTIRELGKEYYKWIAYIEKNFINIFSYDAILVPPSMDSHFDHEFVSNLGSPLTRNRALSLIEYNIVSSKSTWIPNLFIDILGEYHQKYKLLAGVKTQQDKVYFQLDQIDSFHRNFSCFKRGMFCVEQFKIQQLYLE
jgi:LmbE family N-acetylglucosaminyl deacetylase